MRIDLDTPGWVDFGQGRIPRRLAIPTVSGAAHLHLAAPDDHTVGIFSSLLRPVLARGNWPETLTGFFGHHLDLTRAALAHRTHAPVTAISPPAISPPAMSPPARRQRDGPRSATGPFAKHAACPNRRPPPRPPP
ncbi:MAG: hypothetical protein ACRDY2_04610 [Acidimicrobiales bacterium]